MTMLIPPMPTTGDKWCGDETTPSDNEVMSARLVAGGAASEAGLSEEGGGLLLHALCGQWYMQEYSSTPCPLHVWEWLFDIACHCGNPSLGSASFHTLVQLLEMARLPGRESWPLLVPSCSRVLRVLESLGADQDTLSLDGLVGGRLQQGLGASCPRKDGVSDAVVAGLTHLFSYLSLSLSLEGRAPSWPSKDVAHCILLTVAVALDSSLLARSDVNLDGAMHCAMSSFLTCLSEEEWLEHRDELTRCLLALSAHHHDCVHICHMIPLSSSRGETLRLEIIRRYLSTLVKPEEVQKEWVGLSGGAASEPLVDCRLCWSVIKHFYCQHSSAFEYYSMHSAIYLLSMLVASSGDMRWPPGVEAEMKVMLSDLGVVRIKDKAERTERVPVKELLIYFKLEMDTCKRRKSLGQMKLFNF